MRGLFTAALVFAPALALVVPDVGIEKVLDVEWPEIGTQEMGIFASTVKAFANHQRLLVHSH